MMIFEAFSERAVVCLLFFVKSRFSEKKQKQKKKSNMRASHVLLLKINTSHYITHTHTRTDDKAAAHIFLTRTSAHA
jgi:hypothetical protein